MNKKDHDKILDMLEDITCAFWACPGPDEPFKDMATCHNCYAVQEIRKILEKEK